MKRSSKVRPIDPVVRCDLRTRALVKDLGIKLGELGPGCGMSRSAAYSWASGRHAPSTRSLVRLAKSYGISVDWLLGFRDNTMHTAYLVGRRTEGRRRAA